MHLSLLNRLLIDALEEGHASLSEGEALLRALFCDHLRTNLPYDHGALFAKNSAHGMTGEFSAEEEEAGDLA
eukprot:12329513-Heterocapsa_arctica.AAC.1